MASSAKPFGISRHGAYFPRLRIERADIAKAHKWMNPGLAAGAKGSRAFCSWDEDSVTMAVEAGRNSLRGAAIAVRSLTIASTTFPSANLSAAAVVGAALRMDESSVTSNVAGSPRAATTMLAEAFRERSGPALLIASEQQPAAPASAAELSSGAGAAALLLNDEAVIAECLASRTMTTHFVDRFRSAGSACDYVWEERWIRDEGYGKLVPQVVAAALADARLTIDDVSHFILPSPMRAIEAAVARGLGFKGEPSSRFEPALGFCGTAHGFLALSEVLDRAGPSEVIILVGFGQGVDALVLRTTELCGTADAGPGFAAAAQGGVMTHDYLRLLSFQEQIQLDWGMRSEGAVKSALTEQYRSRAQLDGFVAGRCGECGTVQFPVLAYCVSPECNAPASQFEDAPLADEPARILTITQDFLTYYPAPPLCVGMVQFDNGARLLMEIVDGTNEEIVEGQALQMTFRIKKRDEIRGYDQYFWKATPVRRSQECR